MGSLSVGLVGEEAMPAQTRTPGRWIAAVAIVVAVLGAVVILLDRATSLNVKDLFVDPAAKGNVRLHVGVISHAGVLALWTGATALVGAVMLGSRREVAPYPLALGILLALLALDDLYLGHEALGGLLARSLGGDLDRRLLEGVAFAWIGFAWAIVLFRYRHAVARGPVTILVAALACLGASVGVDLVDILVAEVVEASATRVTIVAVVEEMLKFGGISLLSVYAVSVAATYASSASGDSVA